MSCLHAAALRCLRAADPQDKVAQTVLVAQAWRAGALGPDSAAPAVERIVLPGRPPRPKLVHPRDLPHRGLGTAEGRAALIHAIAHIEFNAIDLAWDAIYRFRHLPYDFYADWVGVAEDEARHYVLLTRRLAQYGHDYGDFDAHNGLWEMALKTDDDVLARMALVPRLLEARGLDVTPGMIQRMCNAGDEATAQVLETILREEVAHVAAGSRWFSWLCRQRGVEPRATFRSLLAQFGSSGLKGPFNLDARRQAGFSDEELDDLQRVVSA